MADGFDFNFTKEHLQALIPRAKDIDTWYTDMCEALPQYDIHTVPRVAAFIAQCSHESGGFTILQENLNYKAPALIKLFHTHFSSLDEAMQYEHEQEKIANRIYCNRMGNGDEASGEGWKYHGRGLIQLTGKSNYAKFSQAAFEDNTILDNPDHVAQPYYALYSACWFWNEHSLNDLADAQDIKQMTRKINGGYIGLDERIHNYQHALQVLQG